MVHYRRSRVAGGTFFFTVNLQDRHLTLLVDHIAALRSIVRGVKAMFPFVLDAMVVLPDHWHAVWTLPPNDFGYARRLRLVKARFTKHLLRAGVNISRGQRGEYRLWQKRFWEHTIRDEKDLQHHLDYVHFNPVKHGLVSRVSDWPHSTFHEYVQRGIYPPDWGGCDEVLYESFGE